MLNDFFTINLPYGLRRNDLGEWTTFNREYVPLGDPITPFGDSSERPFIYTKYKGLTDELIEKHFAKERIHRDENGKIDAFFFYFDGSKPFDNGKVNREHFDAYVKKLELIAKLKKI